MKAYENMACAASHPKIDWHQIDWETANRKVRRMQARIVEATKAGRWGKVRALQHLLTHSFYAKALAVKRVTENQGRNTPGVDGVKWDNPPAKAAAISTLRQHGYQPMPLRRVYIPKKNGKMRPLGIPTMRDRAMQALYKLALEPVAETTADSVSYGFRPKRSCADAVEQCFVGLSRAVSAQWVLEGDIKACFDGISHDWLLAHVPMDKKLLRKWLRAGYVERGHLFPTDAGTPQGGIISPTLANMALDGLEAELQKHWPRKGNIQPGKIHLIRYADDFVITGETKELLEEQVKPVVDEFMKERGLTLSPEKTLVTHITTGFDFLGQNVRKFPAGRNRHKLIISPSKKSVQTFLADVRGFIKDNPTMPVAALIQALNPKIRGWALYHRHAVSRKVFEQVDHEIFKALWLWTQRLHKQKSKRWIIRRYWRTMGRRRWVFTGEARNRRGEKVDYTLFKASDVNIKRHTKIQNQANPFDPEWEEYFERRARLQSLQDTYGPFRTILKQQNVTCPICGQVLEGSPADWNLHHIVPVPKEGSKKAENKIFLHPACHDQLHWLQAKGAALPMEVIRKA